MSSSISCGIVGLPNVGKSTIFNALTKGSALAANYPFATIDPNVGIVNVPDERLGKLAEIYNSERSIPATIKFVDIAGLVSGASQGEGLGNQFLSHIRECNLICHVVRDFEDSNVTHVNNKIDPNHDIAVINTELVLADLRTVDKRLPILEKQSKADPKLKASLDRLRLAKKYLDNNTPLNEVDDLDIETLDLNLLSAKPVIYLFNVDEETMKNKEKLAELSTQVKNKPAIFINAQLEAELNSLSNEDAKELLISYGQDESSLQKLIKLAYKTLGLQSYLTAGPKEVRAWTIKQGSSAPEAAGVIHTDFQKGFIAAEVVNYQDLISAGSLSHARSLGKVRTEGKTYIMNESDVVEFRFNV